MKEYTRRITGVIDTRYGMLTINSKNMEDLIFETLGGERQFAGTLSLVITDLTEDTGAEQLPSALPAGSTSDKPREGGAV